VFRHKVEAMIAERVPTMPLGTRKRSPESRLSGPAQNAGRTATREVVRLCLNNPNMIEAHLFKISQPRGTHQPTR